MFDFNDYYDFLAEVVGVSTEALDLAFGLNGCSKKTADDILFYYTGWDTRESFCSANEIEY